MQRVFVKRNEMEHIKIEVNMFHFKQESLSLNRKIIKKYETNNTVSYFDQ